MLTNPGCDGVARCRASPMCRELAWIVQIMVPTRRRSFLIAVQVAVVIAAVAGFCWSYDTVRFASVPGELFGECRASAMLVRGRLDLRLCRCSGWLSHLERDRSIFGLGIRWHASHMGASDQRCVAASLPLWVIVEAILLVHGIRLVRTTLLVRRRRRRNECESCGYSLTGASSAACPECGAMVVRADSDSGASGAVTPSKGAESPIGASRSVHRTRRFAVATILGVAFVLPGLGIFHYVATDPIRARKNAQERKRQMLSLLSVDELFLEGQRILALAEETRSENQAVEAYNFFLDLCRRPGVTEEQRAAAMSEVKKAEALSRRIVREEARGWSGGNAGRGGPVP